MGTEQEGSSIGLQVRLVLPHVVQEDLAAFRITLVGIQVQHVVVGSRGRRQAQVHDQVEYG